jgi:SPX domain
VLAANAAEAHEAYEGLSPGSHTAAGLFSVTAPSPPPPAADEETGSGASELRSPLLPSGSVGLGALAGALSRSLSVTLSRDQRQKEFLEALDGELAKIIRFYLKKEAEVSAKFEELSMAITHAEGVPQQPSASEPMASGVAARPEMPPERTRCPAVPVHTHTRTCSNQDKNSSCPSNCGLAQAYTLLAHHASPPVTPLCTRLLPPLLHVCTQAAPLQAQHSGRRVVAQLRHSVRSCDWSWRSSTPPPAIWPTM